jgi:hypothetical protein
LEAILSQKPDETPQNGEVFDPEAYLRNVEQFDDVEVVIQGRNSVRIDRKQVFGFVCKKFWQNYGIKVSCPGI